MKSFSLLSAIVLLGLSLGALPSEAAPAKAAKPAKTAAAEKKDELPTIQTGYATNLTIQVLRCVRANVPEFGTNNVVVIQYRLKKVGANTGPVKFYGDTIFPAIDIKARDASLGSSFEPIRGANLQEKTYSDDVDTQNWKVGQTGDGYAWFKIPERVTALDVFFPKTSPVRLNIEVPKG